MPWENIGSVGNGQMPRDQAWILFCYDLAVSYLEFSCGEPPLGTKIGVMWHEHELGEYPSVGIYFDYDAPWDFIHQCESALERFDSAVSWPDIQPPEGIEDEFEEEDSDTTDLPLKPAPERFEGYDLRFEVDRHFDESSIAANAQSVAVILMGGVATGKTTMRKQRFATGYVLVDAVDIFLSLSQGAVLPFPNGLEEQMNTAGAAIAKRALSEQRNIVTEIIGAEFEPTTLLIEALKALGYKVEVVAVTCDLEESMRRNMCRDDDAISAYYAEPYQRGWILDACHEITGAQPIIPPDAAQ